VKTFLYLVCILLVIWLLLPILYLFTQIHNLTIQLSSSTISAYVNTIITASIASGVSILIALPISLLSILYPTTLFILTVKKLPGLLLTIPDIVLGIMLLLVYGQNGIISFFFGNIVINTYLGIIIAQLYVTVPYSILILTTCFTNMDKELVESAYALGATEFQVIKNIYIKLNVIHFLRVFVLNIANSFAVFGTLVVVAYYPKVMTTEIFEAFQLFEYNKAFSLALLLTITALLLFIISSLIEEWYASRN